MSPIPQGKQAITSKNDDDVVIVAALRSPITKAKKGGLAQCCPEEILGNVLRGIIAQSKIDPKLVEVSR